MISFQGRDIAIEMSPIDNQLRGIELTKIKQPHEKCLVFTPWLVVRIFGIFLQLLGSLLVLVGCLLIFQSLVMIFPLFMGSLSLFIGSLLYHNTHHFDCETGYYTKSALLSSKRWLIADIVAIQVLKEGWVTSRRNLGTSETPLARYFCYQMNVVMQAEDHQRVRIYTDRNLVEMVQHGTLLANHLRVPFVVSNSIAQQMNLEQVNYQG